MKTFSTLLLGFTLMTSFAKNIAITVYDNQKNPVIGTEIFSIDKTYVGKTNHLGICVIERSISARFDSLYVFKIGFQKTSFSTSNLGSKHFVFVTKCEFKKETIHTDPVQALVKKSIAKIHDNYTSFKIEEFGHYEQQVFANENLVYQLESDLHIEKSSYSNDDETDVLKYVSKKETFNPEDLNKGYFAKEKTQDFIYHYEDVVKSIANHIHENVDETSVYTYTLNGKFKHLETTIYEIAFHPTTENKGMYSGVCHIDSSSQAIVHLEYDITENGLKHFNNKNPFLKIYQFIKGEKENLNKFHYNVSYKKDMDNKFTLHEIIANIEMTEINRKEKSKTILTSDCVLDINKTLSSSQKLADNH